MSLPSLQCTYHSEAPIKPLCDPRRPWNILPIQGIFVRPYDRHMYALQIPAGHVHYREASFTQATAASVAREGSVYLGFCR